MPDTEIQSFLRYQLRYNATFMCQCEWIIRPCIKIWAIWRDFLVISSHFYADKYCQSYSDGSRDEKDSYYYLHHDKYPTNYSNIDLSAKKMAGTIVDCVYNTLVGDDIMPVLSWCNKIKSHKKV